MRGCRWIVALVATVAVATAEAQIRLIPGTKIDSARNIPTTDVGMKFEGGTTVDFGRIDEDGGVWRGAIEWQNCATHPITITRVTSSCGCLRVDYNSATVAPSKRGELRLEYHPKGHAGAVAQRVMIYTDRSGRTPAAVITLRGEVRAAADQSGSYPYACGALLLRQTWVRFAGEGAQVERIACMNGGQKPLEISADTLLSSPDVRVRTEPRVLEAGATGDLVITYKPSATAPKMRPRLLLNGLGVAPRARTIEIFTTPSK